MLIIEKKNVTLQIDMDSNITKQLCEYFSTQPVLKAWVFGSYARGEQGPNSDIDILVRFDRERAKVGLLKYTAIILDLEKILNREVDLVEEGALLPWAEKTVNRDKQLIYERTIA
jgi:predicted nucleotidyltransferase